MRQVYRLLGLAKKWGATRVEAACARALEAEAVDVGLISRMLERATENAPPPAPGATAAVANAAPGRFSRDASDFATTLTTTTATTVTTTTATTGAGS